MSLKLHPFPSFLHPPFGASLSALPVTRDGVRLVPVGELEATDTTAFAELRIRTAQTQAESRGICGLLPAGAFLDGTVRPHEKTLLARLDRQRETVLADGGALGKPVLLTVPSLQAFWQNIDQDYAPTGEGLSFNGQDNDYKLRPFQHAALGAAPPLKLELPGPLVIADGHHRAKTHARLSQRGETSCDFIPVCIIGADELTIGAFTRVIADARAPSALLPELGLFFQHERIAGPEGPTKAGEWLLVCKEACYRLTRKTDGDNSIDSEWLDQTVLPHVFNITDTRSDKRITFKPTPDPHNGLLEFPHKEGKIYLCGFPLPVAKFFSEVAAGHCLPPKSTRFEPRVPSGLVVWRP